ncbi:MAG: hypothetical protein SCM88_04505 [Bacillota bacterium]|nr:hypothetical protein [Bacillota bacterium]
MLFASLFGETLAPQLGATNVDAWAVVSGALGLGAGLLWLRQFGRRAAAHQRYQAVALRIAGRAGSVRIAADELVKR